MTVTALTNSIRSSIPCPETFCSDELSSDAVMKILLQVKNNELYSRYEDYVTKRFLDDHGDFCWCAHGCGSGQMYPRLSHPRMICFNCQKATCFIHHVPWHDDDDCDEYQKRIETVDPKTQNYLDKKTKTCPKCHSNIQKLNGCDHMTCSRCRAEFCWECLVLYRSGDTPYTAEHATTCPNSYQQERLRLINTRPFYRRLSLPRRLIRTVIPRSSTCVIL